MSRYFKETKAYFILSPGNNEHELLFDKINFKTLESVIIELAKQRENFKKELDKISRLSTKIEDISTQITNQTEELYVSV